MKDALIVSEVTVNSFIMLQKILSFFFFLLS